MHGGAKMHAQSRTRILKQACALLLAVTSTVATARPARRSSPPPSHSSGQMITLYTTGVASPKTTASSTRHPVFTNQGSIGHSGSWLRALMRPDALWPGAVTVIDEQLRSRKEFGLPHDGRLKGVIVTSLADNSSHMVAVKASFVGDGADDSLRFFGVRRDDKESSHMEVVGRMGLYSDVIGFAVVSVAGVPEMGGNASIALSFSVHLK